MAVFRLEDQYGDIEVVVFPDLYAKSFGLLANEVSVMVTGKPEVGEDVGKVLARKIILLDEVHHSEAETMTLRIPMDSMSENTIPYLLEILEKHRGDCSVIFELCRKDYVANFQPHKLIKVDPSPELATSLETICGEGAVRFSK